MFQWASSLNMAWGSLEADRVFVKMAVDVDMTKFSALEAGFMVMGMISRKGCIVVTAGPPDFSASNGSFSFFGQW